MLSPADAALCARDPALPGLAAVLDAAEIARHARLGDLQPTYLRYKPGTSCVLGLTPRDERLGAVAAMSYPPARYAEVRSRADWQSGAHPVRFLDDICSAIVPMTRDRKLKAARALRNSERRDRFLARLGLEDATLTLLRYKPGRRLVLRADAPGGRRAVIKAHAAEAFAAAVAGARHAEQATGVPIAAIDELRRTIATHWIEGDGLCPAGPDFEAFHRTGAALARLHLAAPRPGVTVTAPDCRSSAKALAGLLPDLAGQASAAAATLLRRLAKLDPATCAIHGDFSADQVVLRSGQPTFIDWDRMEAGDPARDLGSFLARLDADTVQQALPGDAAQAAGHALLEGYAAAAGALPAGVDMHRAAALLALAPEGFRQRRPHWAMEAEAILSRVDSLLACQGRPSGTPTPGLASASDPAGMGPKLAAALGAKSGESPRIRVLRHKEGRRALLRYDLPGRSPVLGKLRAKGPDRRTPQLHRTLRAAGLDGQAPHRVGVPEPLGEIADPALWLQRLVPGRSLGSLLISDEARAAARRAGAALAILHDTDVPVERAWSMADERAVLERALAEVAAPRDLQPRIDGVLRAASRALDALPAVDATGIHRDFYPDQLLIDAGAAWLLDLDLYALGDPLIDVGNFLAHLTELGLRLRADPDRFGPEAAAFLAGYEGLRGPCDCRRLAVLHWASLARHIAISRRVPGRSHTTGMLVSACERGPDNVAFVGRTRPHPQPAA